MSPRPLTLSWPLQRRIGFRMPDERAPASFPWQGALALCGAWPLSRSQAPAASATSGPGMSATGTGTAATGKTAASWSNSFRQ